MVIGTASSVPGEEVTVAVTFRTADAIVTSVQNDIGFQPQTRILRCFRNRELDKPLTGFNIQAEWMRAIVFSLDTGLSLPDGAVLYTCTVQIAHDAGAGIYPLRISAVFASDAFGNSIEVGGESGHITVEASPAGATPIPSRTPPPTPTATPTAPSATVVRLSLAPASANAGGVADVAVLLSGAGRHVHSAQNDITLPPGVAVVARPNGRPNCVLNPDAGAQDAIFVFLPPGCGTAAGCTGVRAEVIGIADLKGGDSVLYTCRLAVSADSSPGTYWLAISGLAAGDSFGNPLPVTGQDGEIAVYAGGDTAHPASISETDPASPGAPIDGTAGCATGRPAAAGRSACVPLLVPAALIAWRRRQRQNLRQRVRSQH